MVRCHLTFGHMPIGKMVGKSVQPIDRHPEVEPMAVALVLLLDKTLLHQALAHADLLFVAEAGLLLGFFNALVNPSLTPLAFPARSPIHQLAKED